MTLKRRVTDTKIPAWALPALLTALLAGGGSYLLLAQGKADKQVVRDSLTVAKDYTNGKFKLVEQEVDTMQGQVAKMDESLQKVNAIVLIIATQLRADLPDSLKRLR